MPQCTPWDHTAPWGASHCTPTLATGACAHLGLTRPMAPACAISSLSPLSPRIPQSPSSRVPVPSWPSTLAILCSSWRHSGQVQGHLPAGSNGSNAGVPGAQDHLTAGGPGQGHLPPSKDAPGPAAGNFPRHTLFPNRGGAVMPPLFLKAQQAAHPLLFISLPLVGPQPWPPNLASRLQSSPWPRVSPCSPWQCGSGHGSSIPRSGLSPDPPPTRALA